MRLGQKYPVVFLLVSVLLVNLWSCTKRVAVPQMPSRLEQERLLHVRLTSGKEVKVKQPRFEGDFLLGKTPVYDSRPGPDEDIKIPIAEIASIRVERYSGTKTAITVSMLALILGMLFYIGSQFDGGYS